MKSKNYRMCTRCVMDTTDSCIEFDVNGICNHCRNYDEVAKRTLFHSREGKIKLRKVIDEIKKHGKNNRYDCIIGLSGGVDSSYVVYNAKKLGLRPLIFTLDNGWDDKIAKKNVENIVKKLGFDFHSYVIDWKEFKDIQLSFLKASVVDIELLTDHAIKASIMHLARKKNIKYILSGNNIVTEGITPKSWVFSKWDSKNIIGIHKIFGKEKIKTFPIYTLIDLAICKYFHQIKQIAILNYFPYNLENAKSILEKELGWKDYGAKHHESVFTRFYQTYILPKKFNIDKRKSHLSTLICSGQLNREEALKILKQASCSKELCEKDKQYFLQKLNLTESEFEYLMKLPIKKHTDYPSYQLVWKLADMLNLKW